MYDHCVRAILKGLNFGGHGLPLMGSGDWNDGMNMVGAEGKGESVWLGFFLYDVLRQFAEVARKRGDNPIAERCAAEAAQMRRNIEQHGWDGGWYRRAYFDDGSPLGSMRTPNAGLIRLRKAGPFSPARVMPNAHAWPWRRRISALSTGTRR